jgi:hypothetical protein
MFSKNCTETVASGLPTLFLTYRNVILLYCYGKVLLASAQLQAASQGLAMPCEHEVHLT